MRQSPDGNHARIPTLDVLRGFAIGGILFANVLWLSGYLSAPLSLQNNLLAAHPLDQVFLLFTRLFVHAKLYTIFSFLFGLGFSLQYLRAQSNQVDHFVAQSIRRLVVLFIIGWVHAWFFWSGDILRFYAVLAVFLLPLKNQSDRVLLIIAGSALLAPIILALFYQLGLSPLTELLQIKIDRDQTLIVLAQGGWEQFFALNGQRIKFFTLTNIENGRVFKMFGLFVIGFYAGRRGIFFDRQPNQKIFRLTLIWGGAFGGVFSLIRVAQIYTVLPPTKSEVFQQCLYALSVYPLAAAYIAFIVLACQEKINASRYFRPLALVGQMALSHYLAQTLVLTTVFYWWGFGRFGAMPLRYCGALVAFIFLAQIVVSKIWLTHFNQGPIEWFWRGCSRLQWSPFMRPKTVR